MKTRVGCTTPDRRRSSIFDLRSSILALAVAVCALALASGCGSEPALVAVHGKVFYLGKPLPRGTIVFTPDADHGNSGPQASGEIQADGSFVLRTGDAAGAIPGWHRVTVLAVEAPTPNKPRFSVPRSLLPEKYRDPGQSGLTCEVLPGKENGVNFNLE